MTDKQLIGAEAPPAADALDGTEVLHVVQGANSRVATTQDIADLAAPGGSGYVYSGLHQPALTFSADGEGGTIDLDDAGPLGVSRVGSGAGVPSAGDSVVMLGGIGFGGVVNGETATFPLPFEASTSPQPVVEVIRVFGTDVTVAAALISPTVCRLTFTVVGDNQGRFDFRISYQTANAVDP